MGVRVSGCIDAARHGFWLPTTLCGKHSAAARGPALRCLGGGLVEREQSTLVGLGVADQAGDVWGVEQRVGEAFRRGEAGGGLVSFLCAYRVECTHESSEMAPAESAICSRWLSRSDIIAYRVLSTVVISNKHAPRQQGDVLASSPGCLRHPPADSSTAARPTQRAPTTRPPRPKSKTQTDSCIAPRLARLCSSQARLSPAGRKSPSRVTALSASARQALLT